MLHYLFCCSVLLIPSTFGTNSTLLSKIVNKLPSTENTTKTAHQLLNDNHQTTVALMSEGGLIIQNTPTPTLLKDSLNLTLPISLDSELNNDKTITSTKSKVTPRKGVNYTAEIASATLNSTQPKTDTLINAQTKTKALVDKHVFNHTTREHVVPITNIQKQEKVNTTEAPKKPLILSYELLSMDKNVPNNQLIIPVIVSSSKTLTADQISSPKESGPTTQIHPMSTSRHPDMIMPVVITILVVPMFAVLAFMALRRGQEAWKNRHYKRMDFLLDGMYND